MAETVMRLADLNFLVHTHRPAVTIWPMTVSGSSTAKVRTPATVSAMMSGVAPKNAQMGSVNTAITTASSTLTIAVSQNLARALLAP